MARPVPVCVGLLLILPGALFLSYAGGVPTGAAAPVDLLPQVWPAPHDGYTETIPGSRVRFDLVAIPGGSFWMGSPPGEDGRGTGEGPRHPVRLQPFWMGKCEVTWDEYDHFRWQDGRNITSERDNEQARARDADAITRPTPSYADEYRGFGRQGYPVVGISHHAAMEYCRWLSARTGKTYRLPTEAEWEWACRAGTATAYYFGDRRDRLGEYAWYARNADEETHPVGRKRPNPWGLYDMYGNVAEWCLDRYRQDAYAAFPATRLTLGPVLLPNADRFPHVVRGGSWDDPAACCRSAARRGSDPNWNRIDPDQPKNLWWLWNADFVGFRVVRAVDEQENLKGIRSQVTKKSP